MAVGGEDRAFVARYNEPSAPPFARRNEVLVPLEGFELPEQWEE